MISASEQFIYERELQVLSDLREEREMNIPIKEYTKDKIPSLVKKEIQLRNDLYERSEGL